MKKIALVAVIVVAASLAVPLASEAGSRSHRSHGFRHHHRPFVHSRVVIGFGPSLHWGSPYWYYPPPVVYSAPPVIVQEAPPVYVQQAPPAPAPAPEQYWYYCESAKGYYPSVPNCPEEWIKVAPRP
jgi:hypothetical protein